MPLSHQAEINVAKCLTKSIYPPKQKVRICKSINEISKLNLKKGYWFLPNLMQMSQNHIHNSPTFLPSSQKNTGWQFAFS
uniref:Uncharacterized protein n=1 Tax=Rhizophora mucronata TaxID=61149 RepID=A0A2P2QVC6_RHIMU